MEKTARSLQRQVEEAIIKNNEKHNFLVNLTLNGKMSCYFWVTK